MRFAGEGDGRRGWLALSFRGEGEGFRGEGFRGEGEVALSFRGEGLGVPVACWTKLEASARACPIVLESAILWCPNFRSKVLASFWVPSVKAAISGCAGG